ncbi:dipeptide ABC transporter ATP-binding protein [Nocardia asteroides]|uniref:dipeptide ABC transporter ATP-binding protein n=1 Tax=Nocardia asteroides TaxID=1824 RepID=UPI001E2CD90E|nr:ABC transporter ATP-binding protein [Nocardia asteroides]UGT63152.1 ABC transporter ATP-binding protein [Nocardia asteroides]
MTVHDQPLLRVADLAVEYATPGRGAPVRAVSGVSLTVRPGEFVSVVGESGSGKSTTVHAALRLLPGTATVRARALELGGAEISGWGDRRLSTLRGPFAGFVPQDPGTSLNPVKRVGVQVAEAIRLHRKVSAAEARRIALAKLELAGLREPEQIYPRYQHELSGGMKQRVLIAIALANDPKLLVADEPTSALDVTVQKRILDHLSALRGELGLGVLLVTHDLGVAAERSDRLIVMQRGRVVEEGPVREILAAPREEYTRALIAAAPAAHRGRLEPQGPGRTDRLEPAGAGRTGAEPAVIVRPGRRTADGGHTAPPLTKVTAAERDSRALLEARNLAKAFGALRAVDEVALSVRAGSTHALVGESGAGKSTVARIVVGHGTADSGELRFDGAPVPITGRAGLARRRPRELRREIQFVHQNPFGSLDPGYTVERIVSEPLQAFGIESDRRRRRERAAELLDAVALAPEHLRRRPAELSGGQRQRVALARALAAGPRLLVLDEAVSALDVSVQAQILRLLVELQAAQGLTYLFITHDLGVVRLIADDVSVLRAGRVVESGAVAGVFERPEQEYTRTLLAAVPGERAVPIAV